MDRVDSRPSAVGDLDVDLGAVERGFSPGGLVGQAVAVEDVGQQSGGPLPLLGCGNVLAAEAREGEPVAGRGDAERLVRPADHLQGRLRLLGDLVQGAEDVCVVELDGPYAGQSAEDAREFGAVHAAQFGHPQRQFAVAVGAGAVDHRVMGAQARPQDDLLSAEVHRGEHVVAVVRPVSGDLVQLPLAEDR